MKYAEVSVNSPVAQRRMFSYSVPPGLDVKPGQAVLVPFGEKELQGIVLELTAIPAVEDTRDIIDIIEAEPILSPNYISLARWISEYYLAPLFDAVAPMLPSGFERPAVTFLNAVVPRPDTSALDEDFIKALELIPEGESIRMKDVEKTLGKKRAVNLVSRLVARRFLTRSYELGPVRIKPKYELFVQLKDSDIENLNLTPRQSELVDYLKARPEEVSWRTVRQATGCTRALADSLVKKGLVTFREREVRREPISYNNIVPSHPLKLTAAQQAAFDVVSGAIGQSPDLDKSPQVFLLHGVTGSGKTEIYLQALAEAVKAGKKGIVLVPEISLTPQTIERFAARFPHRVAVMHSKLSLGEQYDEWRRIKKGEFDVVVGSRSAVFTPQPDLGLIVIDEEHEWTYKQDNPPHYHARDVAVKLAGLTGAVVVLGSATPDVTTYYKARSGEYKLLTLPERVVPDAGSPLPKVEVVDMREELKAGVRGMFSRSLSSAINAAVSRHEQVILFLNRRGGATFIQCRHCGFVMRCRRCDVPLAQNLAGDVLTCYQCNYKVPVPTACPNCKGRQFKYLGAGTQKLEQEIRYAFPRARQLRWDSDATAGKGSHEAILQKFRSGEADILLGTQMVAKGLDIPSVSLVGVISADTALNIPDFRSGERTFQLLSQVAGRAGRGAAGGRVIVQTFSPENYAIRAAAAHDYESFFEQEITYRRQLRYPPFTGLARLVFRHTNALACQRGAERMKKLLEEEISTKGIEGIDIIGPAPAFFQRLRGRYRWQIILRGRELADFLAPVAFPRGWVVDIDPVGLVR